MKELFSKKRISTFLVFLVFCITTNAQNETKHTVMRGETLESIATKYGTTTDEIIKLNPNAAQFVYVGMELKIPEIKKEQEETTHIQEDYQQIKSTTAEVREQVIPSNTPTEERSKWVFCLEVGYGFLSNSGTSHTCYAYEACIGANYTFTEHAYAGFRIGYNSANSAFLIGTSSGTSESHLIEIPLEIGYAFSTENKKFAIIPFGGTNINIGLSGKTEIKGYDDIEHKIGGKLGIDIRAGVRIRIVEYALSVSYHLPVNDQQKKFFGEDAYLEVSWGFGF